MFTGYERNGSGSDGPLQSSQHIHSILMLTDLYPFNTPENKMHKPNESDQEGSGALPSSTQIEHPLQATSHNTTSAEPLTANTGSSQLKPASQPQLYHMGA